MLGQKRVPGGEGGVEVVVEELSVRMVEKGHEVTCYNRSGRHLDRKIKEYKGICLKTVPTIDFKGIAAMTSSISGAIIAMFHPFDVIHFHAEGPAFMCWLPKMFGKKVCVTIHGLDHQRAKWGFIARTYIMLGEKSAVHFADEIIVLSRSTQKYFEDTYGRKTVYIPNGVNSPVPNEADMIWKSYGLRKDDYILYLGRIVPEKGEACLIQAFEQVKTDKKLVIAGRASDTDDYMILLKKMAEKDDRIIFTGFVQGQLKRELYSNAYLYTLPSELEGMPLSLLEAMSYGNCCLTSDIPECMEVVEDKAVTFQKGDVEDLREKLQMLCDNTDLVEQYRKKAADFICNKYKWEDVVQKTLDIYKTGN